MDKLEPIRQVFRSAGLYHHAADDLLCGELLRARIDAGPHYFDGVNPPVPVAPQATPAAVPAGYVSMPVERVQHVIDLLAERAHLNNARSPAHNARLLLEATLTAANKENNNG